MIIGGIPNKTRQPMPGVRLAAYWAPSARRGCVDRWLREHSLP